MPIDDYAWEKFYKGIDILASSHGELHERLYSAWISALMSVPVEKLPQPLRERWGDIEDRLQEVDPTGSEGRWSASIGSMTQDEVSSLIEQIVGVAFSYLGGIHE